MSWLSKDERDSRPAKTESPAQWIGQAIFVCPLKPGGIIGPVLSRAMTRSRVQRGGKTSAEEIVAEIRDRIITEFGENTELRNVRYAYAGADVLT